MKTSELTGAAIDWAVAQAWYGPEYDITIPLFDDGLIFSPSTLWAHGGPIIERERIRVEPFSGAWLACIWNEDNGEYHLFYRCPTPLIAAMRCYVASKLGDEIEIPEELK